MAIRTDKNGDLLKFRFMKASKTFSVTGNKLPKSGKWAVEIPSMHDGFPVTKICNNAFVNCYNLVSVTIPDGVRDVGEFAFYCCANLVSVQMPDSIVNIGNAAFMNCRNLEVFNFPKELYYVGTMAFCGDGMLKAVNLPSGVGLCRQCFAHCSSLTKIILTDARFDSFGEQFEKCENLSEVIFAGDMPRCIGIRMFGNTNLTEAIIPDGVIEIGHDAFECCGNLKKAYIPKSVKEIGTSVFHSCDNLVSIVVDPDNKTYDSREGCNAVIFTEENELLFGCGKTFIPNTVVRIAWSAFYSTYIQKIHIPPSVMEISSDAFKCAHGFKSIFIPKTVKTMGRDVFAYCEDLKDIYCESKKEDVEWDECWNCDCDAVVHWGATEPK